MSETLKQFVFRAIPQPKIKGTGIVIKAADKEKEKEKLKRENKK